MRFDAPCDAPSRLSRSRLRRARAASSRWRRGTALQLSEAACLRSMSANGGSAGLQGAVRGAAAVRCRSCARRRKRHAGDARWFSRSRWPRAAAAAPPRSRGCTARRRAAAASHPARRRRHAELSTPGAGCADRGAKRSEAPASTAAVRARRMRRRASLPARRVRAAATDRCGAGRRRTPASQHGSAPAFSAASAFAAMERSILATRRLLGPVHISLRLKTSRKVSKMPPAPIAAPSASPPSASCSLRFSSSCPIWAEEEGLLSKRAPSRWTTRRCCRTRRRQRYTERLEPLTCTT